MRCAGGVGVLCLLAVACGGSEPPPERPRAPEAPRTASRLEPAAPSHAPAGEPVAPAARQRSSPASWVQLDMDLLRPAFQACAARSSPPEAAFPGCVCNTVCRARFNVPEGSGVTTVRIPFVDVDGLVFDIREDGTVLTCRYSMGARVLADRVCERASDDMSTSSPSPG